MEFEAVGGATLVFPLLLLVPLVSGAVAELFDFLLDLLLLEVRLDSLLISPLLPFVVVMGGDEGVADGVEEAVLEDISPWPFTRSSS